MADGVVRGEGEDMEGGESPFAFVYLERFV